MGPSGSAHPLVFATTGRSAGVFGMRHEASFGRLPLILLLPKVNTSTAPAKKSSPAPPDPERNSHLVGILLIAIHHHQRPLPVGTLQA